MAERIVFTNESATVRLRKGAYHLTFHRNITQHELIAELAIEIERLRTALNGVLECMPDDPLNEQNPIHLGSILLAIKHEVNEALTTNPGGDGE